MLTRTGRHGTNDIFIKKYVDTFKLGFVRYIRGINPID
jgi:hypothetical protein